MIHRMRHWWLRGLLTIGGLGLVLAALVNGLLLTDLPTLDQLTDGAVTPSTRIYDRNGRLLYQITDAAGVNHTTIPLSEIPLACQHATIATEDAGFYNHPGVDVWGIVRALWINVQGGEVLAGGSTITQQVARNMLLDPQERAERTLVRKLRESILAWRMTQAYSKDAILELYLNQTYYGQLAHGIETAAQTYFGVSARQLDVAQCALLAGLPQAPGGYNPLLNPDAAEERQAVVLGLMVRAGYLDAAAAQEAERQPLRFVSQPFTVTAPHFVFSVWQEIEAQYPPEVLYGGLEITTTLDADLQRRAEQIVQAQLAALRDDGVDHNATNAALVAMDPGSGQVLAYVGSADYFNGEISGAVDMAAALRQPGSALKPFTYALALDPARCAPNDSDCPWTAATVLADVRTSFITREGQPYVPQNFDRQFHGPVTVRAALARSLNVPAVLALEEVGVAALVRLLTASGVSTLGAAERYGLALTLGGGEVRLRDLVGAYAMLANGGQVTPQVRILKVSTADGEVLYEWQGASPQRVLDGDVAYLITDILSDNTARIPTYGEFSRLNIGRPVAVKTGTTTDYRDNWTVGYTPQLVVGVWVGNADYTPMVALSGVDGAAPIWHRVMRAALAGKPEVWYPRPAGLERATVCTLAGQLPGPWCGPQHEEWFIAGTTPTTTEAVYQWVDVDIRTGELADEATPPDYRVGAVRLALAPGLYEWAQAVGWPVLPVGSGSTVTETGLRIVRPDPNAVYRLSAVLPADAQRLPLAVVGAEGLQAVTFYLNGVAVGTVESTPQQVLWPLAVGEYTLVVRGAMADGTVVESAAVSFSVLPPE